MQLMYSAEVSLYFHIIPGTLMHFIHLGTCLKILTVEIGLLHSEPFTHSHFYFLIVLKSATSEGLFQCPNLHSTVFCLHSEMVYPCVITFQETNFCFVRIFKIIPRWAMYIVALGDYAEKWRCFSAINAL
jgi:hypothetical protein